MSEKDDDFLAHYGRKGMKWGKNIYGDEPLTSYNRINRMADGGMGGKNFKSPYKSGINTTASGPVRPSNWGVLTPEQRAMGKAETKKASGGGKGKGGGASKSSSSEGGGRGGGGGENSTLPDSLADINLDGVDPKDMPVLIQRIIDLVIREKINNFSLTDEQIERVGNYILQYRKLIRQQLQA